MVHRHQLDGLARQERRGAVQQSSAEAVIIGAGGDEPAAARELRRRAEPGAALGRIDHRHALARRHGVAVGQAVRLLRGHDEEAVLHAQRIEDTALEEGVEPHARHPLDHQPEHVGRNRIVPRLSRREFERQLPQHLHHAVEVVRPVPLLDLRLAIGGVDVAAILEAVGEARRVAQQVHHSHRRCGGLHQERRIAAAAIIDAELLELGDHAVDRVVERDLAFLHQHHERDRGYGLGHRGDAEQRVVRHRPPVLAHRTEIAEVRHLAVAADQQLHAPEAARLQIALVEEGVDPRQPFGAEAERARIGCQHVHDYPSRPVAKRDLSRRGTH